METEKTTFLANGNQIRKEWKRKKKLLCVKAIKSGKNGNGKKNFSASCQSNQERLETEKTENEARGSQMSNKMRLRMLEMSRFSGIERRIFTHVNCRLES